MWEDFLPTSFPLLEGGLTEFQIHLLDRTRQSVAAAPEGESGAWLEHALACMALSSHPGLAAELDIIGKVTKLIC